MIRLLNYDDRIQYLDLLETFRPVNKDMTENEFKILYDKINLFGKIYICIENNNIIASTTVLYEQKFINNNAIYGHIEDVIVHPDNRGQGIGQMMIDYCIQICKDYKVKKIVLNCEENLRNFYMKNNFIDNGICMMIKN